MYARFGVTYGLFCAALAALGLLLCRPALAEGVRYTTTDLACVITAVADGAGDTRTVTVDRGAQDGLVVGWRGTVHTPLGKDKARARLDIGRAEVTAADPRTATVRVTMPAPTGVTLVRAGDVVMLRARVPLLAARSVLWLAACCHFDFIDSFTNTPYLDYRALYAGETPEAVEKVYAAMVADLRKTAVEYADFEPIKQTLTGRYQGRTLLELLTNVTRDDVAAFLRYVTTDPSLYRGRTEKMNDAFGTWAVSGGMPAEEELGDLLLAAPTPAARAALVATYRDYIRSSHATLDWLDYADTLSDTPGQLDRALRLVAITVEVAKGLNATEAVWWSDYTRGSIYETVNKYPEALAAFSAAITNMRAVKAPTDVSRRILTTALLHKAAVLCELDRYADAAACCSTALPGAPNANLRLRLLKRWGIALTSLGRYAEGRAKFQAMLPLCREADDTGSLGGALLWSAYAASRLGDTAGALATYEQVLALRRTEGDRAGEAEAQGKIASQLWKQGNYQDALAHNAEALAIHRELTDDAGVADALTARGKLYWNTGQYDRSQEAHHEALRLRTALKDVPGQAQSLRELGDLARHAGTYPEAEKRYGDALALYRAAGDRSGQAEVLAEQGRVYKETEQYPAALEAYRQATALCAAIGDQAALARAQAARGEVYEALKDYPNALAAYMAALTTQRAIGAKADQAETLCSIGRMRWTLHAYADADAAFTAALALAQAQGDRTQEASIHLTLGKLNGLRYKTAAAMTHLQRALALYSSPQCSDIARQAETHLFIGDAYYAQADYTRAREAYDRTLALAQQCKEGSLVVRANDSLAWLLRAQGKADEALVRYQETLRQAEAGDDAWMLGNACHTIAVLYSDAGDNAQALAYANKALACYAKITHEYGTANVLTAIGAYYYRQGDLVQSRKYLLDALRATEKLNLKPSLITVLTDLGELAARQHDFATGLPYLQRALAICRESGTRVDTAFTLLTLNEMYRELGETKTGAAAAQAFATAEGYLTEAGTLTSTLAIPSMAVDVLYARGRLAAARRQYPAAEARLREAAVQGGTINARHRLWEIQYQLCLVYKAQGKLRDAETACRASIAVLDALRAKAAGGDTGRETFLRSKIHVYEQMAELLGRINATERDPAARARRAEEAQAFIALARFQVLQQTARGVTIGDAAVDASLQRYERVLRSQEGLTEERTAAVAAGNAEKAARLDKTLAGNEDELAALFADIKAADADLDARLKFDPRRLADSVRDLPAKTTLLAFFPGQEGLHIWVYTAAGFTEWRQVGVTRAQLATLIGRYRAQITDVIAHLERRERIGKGFGPEAERDARNPEWYRTNIATLRQTLAQLYATLIKPVEGSLAGSEQLLILPYGQLCYLPFEALVDDAGAFANARWRFAYVVSEAHLRDTLHTLATPRPADGDTWVAFADPRGRLGSSLDEAREIAPLFARHEIHSKETGDATADTVRALRADCTILHFATHGMLNGERPSLTYLEMATPPGDGTLSQKDVYLLKGRVPAFKQHAVRLVTLSACETALAQNSPEAEVLGMPDAFTMAGAQAVVASLWSVYTYTTSDFMVQFYQRYVQEGHEKSRALQEAKTQLLNDANGRYAHPFYWAPFILFGNWR
jgi:CHAT domain-containing protein/tetratricopeptide (TPR) repeat protein